MRLYRVIRFDIFDTLGNFERNGLPLVRLGRIEIRTTSSSAYEIVKPVCPTVSLEAFSQAFIDSHRTAEAIFIGDTPEADVAGAQAAGMEVIWLDRGTPPPPIGLEPPRHIVS